MPPVPPQKQRIQPDKLAEQFLQENKKLVDRYVEMESALRNFEYIELGIPLDRRGKSPRDWQREALSLPWKVAETAQKEHLARLITMHTILIKESAEASLDLQSSFGDQLDAHHHIKQEMALMRAEVDKKHPTFGSDKFDPREEALKSGEWRIIEPYTQALNNLLEKRVHQSIQAVESKRGETEENKKTAGLHTFPPPPPTTGKGRVRP